MERQMHTQGIQSKVDIDKIGELIDQADETTIYISEWRARRGQLAHLLRAIDVRLFGIPPNVSVAAVRVWRSFDQSKTSSKSTPLKTAKDAVKASRLSKAILRSWRRNCTVRWLAADWREAIEDFLRIQRLASWRQTA
jgi:hypothetical protein